MNDQQLKTGTQIAYVPDHAEGDIKHADVQFGFVTTVRANGDAFCRYWSRSNPSELRTRFCSELTPARCLVLYESHPQAEVDAMLYEIEREG